MRLDSNSIIKLYHYIQNNEVVYQSYGDLIEVANEQNTENRKFLLNHLSHASSVEIYTKGASFIHEPFEDLDNWSTEDDALFLFETIGTLVCIPRRLATENNIIAA